MQKLQELSSNYFSLPVGSFKRYLYYEADLRYRFIGILGHKGTGKSTLMQQLIQRYNLKKTNILYVDMKNFSSSLSDLAIHFSASGGELLVLDNVVEIKKFAKELALVYDFTQIKILFSSSSIQEREVFQVHLKNKVMLYELKILSFREFLALKYHLDLPPIPLETIIKHHQEIAKNLSDYLDILTYFKNYQAIGAYPFFTENEASYLTRLKKESLQILFDDLTNKEHEEQDFVQTLDKILQLMQEKQLYTLDTKEIQKELSINAMQLYDAFFHLQQANLIEVVEADFTKTQFLNKSDKIYFHNCNIHYMLNNTKNKQVLMETFFISMTKVNHNIKYSKHGNFTLNNTHNFEIGQQHSFFEYINEVEKSYIVADGIKVGLKNKIPLWLFGFLY